MLCSNSRARKNGRAPLGTSKRPAAEVLWAIVLPASPKGWAALPRKWSESQSECLHEKEDGARFLVLWASDRVLG